MTGLVWVTGASASAAHLASAHGLPPGHPLLAAAARDQELLYRELLSRPPYSADPLLAHQVMFHKMFYKFTDLDHS